MTRWLAILMLVALFALAAACGDDDDDEAEEVTATTTVTATEQPAEETEGTVDAETPSPTEAATEPPTEAPTAAPAPEAHSVEISGFAFDPAAIEVVVWDSITWGNSDGVPHTATADDGSFDTRTLNQGASGEVTFDAAGEFPYHCEIHPQMLGVVTVVG